MQQAGLYPSPEQIKLFSSHLPNAKLPDILVSHIIKLLYLLHLYNVALFVVKKMFEGMAQVDGNYFLCEMDDQKVSECWDICLAMPHHDVVTLGASC